MQLYYATKNRFDYSLKNRFLRSGKVYTPTKTKNYEYLTRFYFTQKYQDYTPVEGRVKISIIAYFDIPKSTSKKKEAEMLENRISPRGIVYPL